MTPKEALNVIWHDSYELKVEAYHVLQLLVFKSIPIKPIYIKKADNYACSACLTKGMVPGVHQHCWQCGRKIEWSDL